MKIAIQGIRGAFHEVAANMFFIGQELTIIENNTFEDLVNSVNNGTSDFGVIAIENTIAGTIYHNLDLIKDGNFDIIGEIFLRIKQNLAVLPGVKIEDLKEVHSHYMAINQTRLFFEKYPFIKLVECPDTALAFQNIKEKNLTTVGAIGGELAAKMYGLDIVGEGIETNKKNYTRFFVIQKKKEINNSDFNKASLHFIISNNVGSLTKILSVISAYGIDLTKIESLPILGKPFQYRFFIDVIFSEIKQYKLMLDAIRPLLDELDILGEYMAGEIDHNEINS